MVDDDAKQGFNLLMLTLALAAGAENPCTTAAPIITFKQKLTNFIFNLFYEKNMLKKYSQLAYEIRKAIESSSNLSVQQKSFTS